MKILITYETSEVGFELLSFLGHVFGTCAVFYVLFLCRVLGAGDIKLLAISIGFLGIERGAQMIVCGLLLALVVEIARANVWKCGYPDFKGMKVRLAPYLFLGYCLFALFLNG